MEQARILDMDMRIPKEESGYMGTSFTWYKFFKRVFDIFFALLGLAVLLPLLAIVGVAVKLEDGGPVFFVQERLGLYGKPFNLVKLRSMRIDAEKNGPQWARPNDFRVTRVGRVILKTRIDELPQVFNVLTGDMSIVGPRPERAVFYREFERRIPRFADRLQVKPGITGYAQINGGYELTPKQKWDLDMKYVNSRNLLAYLKIVLMTVRVVLTGEGAF